MRAFHWWEIKQKAKREGESRRTGGQHWHHFAFPAVVDTRALDLQALGLPGTASEDEIKAAYRRLASRHHPDKGGNAAEFVRVRKAYERLNGLG